MNFDEAIKVHTYWKVTLRWMINGHRPVIASEVADFHRCELGHWIDGEGQAYAHLPEFEALVHEHAEFHRIAGMAVEKIQRGEAAEAEAMLAPDGAFTQASARTIETIRALKAQVEPAG